MSFSLNDKRPIGIFDSGLGGLTVLKCLLENLPNEEYIYLGDLANLPYGNKSTKSIIDYSIKCIEFLQSKNVKCIIVACNTASSVALKSIKELSSVPVFDVINPCVDNIVRTDNKKVAIIGTEKTIESDVYSALIKKHKKNIKIYTQACPLFVPIVEEGLGGSKIAKLAIEYYLSNIRAHNIDQLVLGCTHYPVIIKELQKYFNDKIDILHSGPFISEQLLKYFKQKSKREKAPIYYVTDLPDRFQTLGNRFFNQKINSVTLVNI